MSFGNGTGRLRDDGFGLFSIDVILTLGETDDATKSGALHYHHFQKFCSKNHPHQCLPILFSQFFDLLMGFKLVNVFYPGSCI